MKGLNYNLSVLKITHQNYTWAIQEPPSQKLIDLINRKLVSIQKINTTNYDDIIDIYKRGCSTTARYAAILKDPSNIIQDRPNMK